MKKGFTLIEVNLAMMIMAMGVLSIVGLYAHGYRESDQSREDVEAAALADHVISPLVAAISHTNMSWRVFRKEFYYPDRTGWGAYFNNDGRVAGDPQNLAERAFTGTMGALQAASLQPSTDSKFPSMSRTMSCALVVMHDQDSPIVRIAFRATKNPGTLMGMPLFYTEARFQGDPNK